MTGRQAGLSLEYSQVSVSLDLFPWAKEHFQRYILSVSCWGKGWLLAFWKLNGERGPVVSQLRIYRLSRNPIWSHAPDFSWPWLKALSFNPADTKESFHWVAIWMLNCSFTHSMKSPVSNLSPSSQRTLSPQHFQGFVVPTDLHAAGFLSLVCCGRDQLSICLPTSKLVDSSYLPSSPQIVSFFPRLMHFLKNLF